jgi:hypothetical protein
MYVQWRARSAPESVSSSPISFMPFVLPAFHSSPADSHVGQRPPALAASRPAQEHLYRRQRAPAAPSPQLALQCPRRPNRQTPAPPQDDPHPRQRQHQRQHQYQHHGVEVGRTQSTKRSPGALHGTEMANISTDTSAPPRPGEATPTPRGRPRAPSLTRTTTILPTAPVRRGRAPNASCPLTTRLRQCPTTTRPAPPRLHGRQAPRVPTDDPDATRTRL